MNCARFLTIPVLLTSLICQRAEADERIDTILSRVNQAREDYDAECATIRERLMQSLEEEIDGAQRAGSFERVTKLRAERDAFKEKEIIPKAISTSSYTSGLVRARDKLIATFERARKELTQAGDLEHAGSVDTEITKLKSSQPGTPMNRGKEIARVLWVKTNRTQYFLKGPGTDWFEKAENGKRAEIFTERGRTSDYVELRHNTMPITIRLGATSIFIRLKDADAFVEAKDSGAWIQP